MSSTGFQNDGTLDGGLAPEAMTSAYAMPRVAAPGPSAPSVDFRIARGNGAVTLTVAGILDARGCALVEALLRDLIEGQGNLTVECALRVAVVEPAADGIWERAHALARERGGVFRLLHS